MKLAIYPGSFDPVTYGHLNVIERGAQIVDRLIVAVLDNPSKHSMFTMEERVDMLKQVTKHIPNVEVDCSHGLLYEYAKQKNCQLLIRATSSLSTIFLLVNGTSEAFNTAFSSSSNNFLVSITHTSLIEPLISFESFSRHRVEPSVGYRHQKKQSP